MREVSAAWGLVHRHHRGASGRVYMPETMGSGVAIFDFFVDSGAMPGYEGEPARSVLYRNEGGRRFRDVTDAAGIRVAGYGMGATAAIFSFIWTWDDFLGPLVYLNDVKDYTVPLALRMFNSQDSVTQYGQMFAMSILSLLPIFLFFVIFQRLIIRGIAMSGLK